MTDQTIAVPVELLKRLAEHTAITHDVFEGIVAHVSPEGIGAIIDLKSFIPAPPKVGDTLTADQIKKLPRKAVVRDKEGDLWVSDGLGTVSLLGFNPDGRIHNFFGDADELAGYSPVLALLPTE